MDTLLTRASAISPVGPYLATFILGFITVIILYWYSSQKQSYWKNLGVPYVEPSRFVGSVITFFSTPTQDLELENYQKKGRIYGYYQGNMPLLSVAEPELLRSILVKDFHAFSNRRNFQMGDKVSDNMLTILQGEDWKRVRTVVTPTFTIGKIKRMIGIFKDCSKTLVQNFKQSAEKGEPVEVKTIYSAFTMDIIASSAFSTKIDSHNDPKNEFVASARNVFIRPINWRFILFFMAPRLMKLLGITIFSSKGLQFFRNVTLSIMEERKKKGQTRNDFLQLLMDTAKEVKDEGKLDAEETEKDITDNYANEENEEVFKSVTKKTLSLDEVVAQCVIFFLAGFDTTASTLSFASYILAFNPDVQERLIKEIDAALHENNGELTYEAVQSMKTLDNVISETLRLYPPATRLERVAEENYKLGDTGIVIPKGMVVSVPVYALHRDPEHFPDPEKFNPDRFTAEERAKRHQYSYMPFGSGPRSCVGLRFALLVIKVCLAHVISNFRIKRCSKTKVPLEYYLGQGLLQPKEITLQFEIRKDTAKSL